MTLAWEILFGIGALVLFGALIYGMVQDATRNRANDRITEEATEAEYDRPGTYARERQNLVKKLRPPRRAAK